MDIETLQLDAEERMEKALVALERDFGKLRTGRATTSLVDNIKVDYYGTLTPIQQLASVAVPDSRTVTRAEVTREGEMLTFTVEADGFLYNMVRIMIGTLVDLSDGKRTPADIAAALSTGDRQRAGRTAPAEGLILSQVFYDFNQKEE